ncbi:MAG: RND family transporter [Deltaproteobacteria bacterium]|nr:RND family transporter [Deltaproteobacteria bacterium]
MRLLTAILIKWPWLTVLVVLGISAAFATQLKYVRIDNELKSFLPETHYDRQQLNRAWEIFGSELVMVIGISVKEGGPYRDIYDPRVLAIVDELTDWLESLEIEAPADYTLWVKPEQADAIIAGRSQTRPCSEKQKEKVKAATTPANLQDYIKLWICKAPKSEGLEDIVSLASTKVIYDDQVPRADGSNETEHMLKIEDLWDEIPRTPAEADVVRKRVASWSIYSNNLVSMPETKSGLVRSTAIYAFLDGETTIEYGEELQNLVEEKIASIEKREPGLIFQTGGLPFLSVWLGKYLQRDLRQLIPYVMAAMLFVLIVSFRNIIGVVLPLITVGLGTLWAVCFAAFLHKPLTVVTASIPTLITAVGSAYTIHVLHTYFDLRREGRPKREAVLEGMEKVGAAVFMAGMTTIGGFISLSTSSVIPIRDFGYLAAFGAFSCLVVSLSFAPAMLMLFDRKKYTTQAHEASPSDYDPSRGVLGAVLAKVADFVGQRKIAVVLFALVFITVCGLGAKRLSVTSDMAKYFLAHSEIRRADDYLKENFGGTSLFSITLDGKAADYWKDPKALSKLDRLVAFVDRKFSGRIGKSLSLNDYVKKMWMALHNDDPAYFRIPDSAQGVADCLFLYSQSSDSLSTMVDFDYRETRVSFKMKDGDTRTMRLIKREVDSWMAAHFPEMVGKPAPSPGFAQWLLLNLGLANPTPDVTGADYHLSGDTYLQYSVDQLVVLGQMRSLSFSVLIVLVLSAIIFRSFVGGLLSIVPILMTVLGNFAVMGFWKIPLDIGTALVANAAVGCGIDYAIHYINRYRLKRLEGYDETEAIKQTHLTSGKAIVFNAVAVALGFFVLIFSNFNPVIRLGILTGITMLTSSFMALTVLPPLLVWLKPRFIRKINK